MKSSWKLLLLTTCCSKVSLADTSNIPRGVGPEFAKFYADPETFTCLSSPSQTLARSRLNDDFCDCADGSDEPGTSACSHLSPLSPHFPYSSAESNVTLALPGFWCNNEGHVGAYLSFERVNDGICDYDTCCDGSDEWAAVGGVKCENRCAQIHKEWKAQDDARQRSMSEALKRKRELLVESAKLKKEAEDHKADLEKEVEAINVKIVGLEAEVAEIEKKEHARMIRRASGAGGKVTALAALAKQRVEELRSKLMEIKSQRDAQKARVTELEGILTAFKEEYNPNFNDEGVKRAVRSWEDYVAREKTGEWSDAEERDLEEIMKVDGENDSGIDWEEWEREDDEEDDIAILYNLRAYVPPTLLRYLDGKLFDLKQWAIANGILAPPGEGDDASKPESKVLSAARTRLSSATSERDKLQQSLNDHADSISRDYGKDDIFRALKGTCINADIGEYTYELCFAEKVTQRPRSGHGSTNMGTFSRFDVELVDEDVRPDGRGLGSGERQTMVFENGARCWNGPHRRTVVAMGCAQTDEIWKVAETEKCVYWMEIGTAAVCEENKNENKNDQTHRNDAQRKDEL